MKKYLIYTLFLLSNFYGLADCGNIFMLKHDEVDKLNEYRSHLLNSITQSQNNNKKTSEDQDTIRIPVVFNILYNDSVADAKLFNKNVYREIIDSANMILNIDLNRIIAMNREEYHDILAVPYIQLIIAKVDPNGQPTDGFRFKKWTVPLGSEFCEFPWITGQQKAKLDEFGGITAWDNKNYLNYWIGNFGLNGGCYSGQSTYPSFPFLPGQLLNFMDGILIRDYLIKGNHKSISYFSTFAHELGHYLGLIHIWGGIVAADEKGCNIDDGIKDTPNQYQAIYSCSSVINSCIDPIDDKNDMCSNIMDYADGISFTKGQVQVMRNAALNIRKELTIPKLTASLSVSSNSVCPGQSVLLQWTDQSNRKQDYLFSSWNNAMSISIPINQDTTFTTYLSNGYDTIFQTISIEVKTPPNALFSFPDTVNLDDTLSIDFFNTDTIYSVLNFNQTLNTISFLPNEAENNQWIYFSNSCFKDSIFVSYQLQNITSKKNNKIQSLKIYPNPATSIITIENKNQQIFNYQIFDLKGSLYQKGNTKNQIDIDHLPKGNYILKIQLGKEFYTEKFTKE